MSINPEEAKSKMEILNQLLSKLRDNKEENQAGTSKNDEKKDESRKSKSYIQIIVRMLINVEALNMVESIGNVTRHRTVPVIIAEAPGKYYVRWVPAISGETLAHRYQEEIVDIATMYNKCGERIDYWSKKKEFLKHWDLRFYKQQCNSSKSGKESEISSLNNWECNLARNYVKENQQLSINDIRDIEKTIVNNSVVEDIAGFLVTQGPTRRTSCIRFSYAIPTLDALLQSQVDHQMHVRGALEAQSLKLKGFTEAIQIPYYVQVGSVLYGFNIELNTTCVGCYSLDEGCVQDSECGIDDRRCIALHALRPILDGDFGAKRTRFRPHSQLELAIAVVSDKPIPLPPATLKLDNLLREIKAKIESYKNLNGTEADVYALVPHGVSYREQLKDKLKETKVFNKEDKIADDLSSFFKKIRESLNLNCKTHNHPSEGANNNHEA